MNLKSRYACMILALFVAFSIQTATLGQSGLSPKTAQRLVFARGTISIRANGTLRAKQDGAYYVVRASAGQHMIVHTSSLTAEGELVTLATVTSPSGAQDGEKGSINFNADLTETGDYVIRVTRNLMATNGSGTGPFLVEVVIF